MIDAEHMEKVLLTIDDDDYDDQNNKVELLKKDANERQQQKKDKRRRSSPATIGTKKCGNGIKGTKNATGKRKATKDDDNDVIYKEAFTKFEKDKRIELQKRHPEWKSPRIALAICMIWYKEPGQ